MHEEPGKIPHKWVNTTPKNSRTTTTTKANSPRRTRWQEIKLRAEINKIETTTTKRINEMKSRSFEKINKIEKPLSKLTKRQRENIQINKIRIKMEDVTTDTKEIQRIIRTYFENLHSTKLENIKKMYNFLDKYHLPN